LRRKHAMSAEADRLLSYIDMALARITREVHKVDALMARLEDRDAMRANPVRLRTRRPMKRQPEREEHDESVSDSAERADHSSESL